MKITSLKLLNFRNYEQQEIKFSDSINILYGKNGMGKTNLIEAIYVLALTKSFRTINDQNLINQNKELTKISGEIKAKITNNYQVIISKDGKKVKINNNLCKKMSDYISKISVILFNPEDLKLIKDTPNYRRKSLNIDISELDNNYLILLSKYNKLLKQRNSYLKTMYYNSNTSLDYLNILTDKIIDLGLIIYQKRKQFIELINDNVTDIFKKINKIGDLKLKYLSNYADLNKEAIKEKYQKYLEKDMLFGKTQFGIHHDDILFIYENNIMKDFASEGRQKNAIIAYKLAEILIFKQIKQEIPILILDDLSSELDKEKINGIINLLDQNIQTFITTTDVDNLNIKLQENSKLFHIVDGKVEEV